MRECARCLPFVPPDPHFPLHHSALCPRYRQLQKVPITPLRLANSEPWRLEGRWRVKWEHIVPQFLPYRVCFIHSAQGYSSLHLDSGNLPPSFRPWSAGTSVLLVLRSSLTICVSLHTAHIFIKSSLLHFP